MKNIIVTGIGCFAKPEKLSRIFLKMVRIYTLGQIEGIDVSKRHEWGDTESTRLVEALIAGESLEHHSLHCDSPNAPEYQKITGFFLTLKDQKLNLSIFAKKRGSRQERHSAVLDVLTNIRRSRLN
jgi:hypothetical protein